MGFPGLPSWYPAPPRPFFALPLFLGRLPGHGPLSRPPRLFHGPGGPGKPLGLFPRRLLPEESPSLPRPAGLGLCFGGLATFGPSLVAMGPRAPLFRRHPAHAGLRNPLPASGLSLFHFGGGPGLWMALAKGGFQTPVENNPDRPGLVPDGQRGAQLSPCRQLLQ